MNEWSKVREAAQSQRTIAVTLALSIQQMMYYEQQEVQIRRIKLKPLASWKIGEIAYKLKPSIQEFSIQSTKLTWDRNQREKVMNQA